MLENEGIVYNNLSFTIISIDAFGKLIVRRTLLKVISFTDIYHSDLRKSRKSANAEGVSAFNYNQFILKTSVSFN